LFAAGPHRAGHGLSGQQVWRAEEVSGYHHNVAYDFLSLRPAICAAGKGAAVFREMRYAALENSTKS
jgi:hypothetical protein